METKICKQCGEEKSINDFQKGRAKCKKCVCLRQKQWYMKNQEKILIKRKEYRTNNKEKIKKWKKENKDKINETRRIYTKNRLQNDYIFKLKLQLRKMLKRSFERKNKRKDNHTEEILGCNTDFFIKYLLQTYKNNYGCEWDGIEAVHIDHIVPLATVNTKEDVIKLCNYRNLQLLKAKDNLKKGIKIDYELKGD